MAGFDICAGRALAVAAVIALAACQTLESGESLQSDPARVLPVVDAQDGDAPAEASDAGAQELAETPEARRAMLPQFRNQPTDDGCNVEMATVWRETERGVYAVEVRARGAACASAEVSLALRGPTMRVLWRETFSAAELAGFDRATDARRMRSTLVSWITSGGSLNLTARQLPPPNRETPSGGRFVVDEELGVDVYEGVRRDDGPIFCYVAGLDRSRCVALVNDGRAVVSMGAQIYGEG